MESAAQRLAIDFVAGLLLHVIPLTSCLHHEREVRHEQRAAWLSRVTSSITPPECLQL